MSDVREDHTKNNSLLASVIVVATTGFSGHLAKLLDLASYLADNFVFYEILLIEPESAIEDVHSLVGKVAEIAPQVRHLQFEEAADFDTMASLGYAECIGDVIALTSIDELEFVDFSLIIGGLTESEGLVRVRRRGSRLVETVLSRLINALTGMNVDTRFCRTMALTRNVLSGLSARPEQIALFRFTSHRHYPRQRVIQSDMPQTRKGLQLLARRVDIFTRLLATSASRLLRVSSALCMTISLAAFMVLAYVMLVWTLKAEIAEGWSSSVMLMSLLLFAQMAASSIMCLGLSKLLERQDSLPRSRQHLETTVSDLFGSRAKILNVQPAEN